MLAESYDTLSIFIMIYLLQQSTELLLIHNDVYRLILRCRQEARARFARLRSDVLVKMELLDNKHVQDVVWQLQRLVAGLAEFHGDTLSLLQGNSLFPIEVDLSRSAFQYKSTSPVVQVSHCHCKFARIVASLSEVLSITNLPDYISNNLCLVL